MNWKLYLACSLCLALSLTSAQSTPVNIIEIEYYEFTFETASGGFWGYHHHTDERWYASEDTGSGEYYPTATLWLWDYHKKPLNLRGMTLGLGFSWSPSESLEAIYGPWDGWDYWGGSVTFGADNQIVEWDLSFGNESGDDMYWRSDPVDFDPSSYSYWRWSADAWDDFSGSVIYGQSNDAAPDYISFYTNPGRWLMNRQTYCLIEADGEYGDQVPCADPVPPQNGCGPSGGAPRKCDQIAVAPLPPSLMLLASGLAGVGLFRRRRKEPAG